MSSIIQRLDLADINDCLYFDYCTKENVDFYIFDSDLKNLGTIDNYIVSWLPKINGVDKGPSVQLVNFIRRF